MRVTADTKEATRQRLLAAARDLFAAKGFEATTTRDLAAAAGIAAGTLFNYFATKEAIVMALAADALADAAADYVKRRRGQETLEEDLFFHVSTGLRRLRPCRKFLHPVLETSLSPLAKAAAAPVGESLRLGQLERVQQILAAHGGAEQATTLVLNLYWALYAGVLSFWVGDTSPNQEDTLAMLDQALRMFVNWFQPAVSQPTN